MERVAVDLDMVLADIRTPAIERSDILVDEDLCRWDAVSEEKFADYMHWSCNMWDHHWDEIPLLEPEAPSYMADLGRGYRVDILTARCGYDEQIVAWLDRKGIVYDGFYSTPVDKCYYEASSAGIKRRDDADFIGNELKWITGQVGHLGYHYFVDDNPNMVGYVENLFLRDHPWNENPFPGIYIPATRVYSLEEVVDALYY